ncbi:hypothetical protein [Chlorobium sp. N1]|uniref:hypothetical protein n=1 Tax=Chlorobium sp. N1 TaxID=2491138 RepID=UPI00103C6350|nr:hypothetical protein [Chlorobium sp. N1]TCD47675.1 hypothetical protein E0L29_07450 [Chlorobium sp. N1]
MMTKHDDERKKWERIGHRLMQSSDLQLLCGLTRTSPGAEKPFVSSLADDELEGMTSFVLERMKEVDLLALAGATQDAPEIPHEYRDHPQAYLRLQVPKNALYRSSELYNAEFINDLDEGYDTLQGVFVTLVRALGYLFDELQYRHGSIDPAFMHALERSFPEYAAVVDQVVAGERKDAAVTAPPATIKLTLTPEQLADLSGCLEVFFDPSDRPGLTELLQGRSVGRKLVFNGNQNRLVEVFRRLSYNGFLYESSTVLRDWLCGHFAYRSKAGIADLSQNSVWDILSKAKGEPTLKSRICVFGWLAYKTHASLKRAD